jgi:Ca-activated chloride channel family protein
MRGKCFNNPAMDSHAGRCEFMVSVLISAMLVTASLPFCSPAIAAAREDATFTRVFNEFTRTIMIENLAGPTDVRTWQASTVSVTASRPYDANNARVESEVLFERPARDSLRVVTNPNSLFRPIALTVLVPSASLVSVRGGTQRVSIKGLAASLSVETASGNVSIYLPEKANTDLSLRAIRGVVESRLPVTIFGQADAHMLDGKLGAGGSPLIARSQRGNITLFSEAASFTAPANPGFEAVAKANPGNSGTNVTGLTSRRVSSSDLPRGGGGSSEEAIRLEARLVNLNVKVTDAGGKTLPALTKEDFIVLEDDLRQDVSYFEPVTAPLHIVLLLDLSGSTEHKIKVMKKAAQKFVDSLKPTDRIAAAAFTRRFFIISNFTTDHKLLKDRIGDIKNRHAGTAYYDAMWATLDLLEEEKTTRKAIVVLTDGVDNSLSDPDNAEFDPSHSFDELLARAEEADATIYPIYLDTEYETIGAGGRTGHEAYVTARKQLQALADQTGAMVFKADRAEDLEGVYQQVAAELHSLYSMAYAPKIMRKDGKWRKISIAVDLPGARVRTKRGYFAK